MTWDWSETADPRVVELWHLRTRLSACEDVVYAKWFQGRATFFSRAVFTALLRLLDASRSEDELSGDAAAIYGLLLDDTPQTPQPLRAALGLEGRHHEAAFQRALRELWQRLLIVGFGESDEGSFPALAIGATRRLFENLWNDALALDPASACGVTDAVLAPGTAFERHLRRVRRRLRRS
jgi:hypothetical protein